MATCIRCVVPVLGALLLAPCAQGDDPAAASRRPDAAMLQFPDVSATDIVFVYGNDLWLVAREGGVARPVASPPGRETFPKFSPDGATVAFIGNYDGNKDVYTIPAAGGLATRVTHHPAAEVTTDWSPDGRVIFYASGQNGLDRQQSIFIVGPNGGMPERLPVPYGTTATISPDGSTLAYTLHTHDFRTWKRYRGGWATDIWLFDLNTRASRKITDWEGTDTFPMWQPGATASDATLYYLCDDGPSHRANIWAISTRTNQRSQVTTFDQFDVKWPSIGPGPGGQGEIVFQNGPHLFLLDLATRQHRRVEVVIPGDLPTLRQQQTDCSKVILNSSLSPTGKRVIFSARGDLWELPAEKGVSRRLTATSGVAERDPAYSPDARHIAYLSDETGEYEIYLADAQFSKAPLRLTSGGTCFRFMNAWSPDSKHFVFNDKTGAYFLHTLGGPKHDGSEPGATIQFAKDVGADSRAVSWSSDSSWIALALSTPGEQSAIWLYNVAAGALTQVTSDMFDSFSPAFDRAGDFFYFISTRRFVPTYSDIDLSFVYRDGRQVLAVPLRAGVKNPLAPKDEREPAVEPVPTPTAKPAYQGVWKGSFQDAEGDPTDITLTLEPSKGSAQSKPQSIKGEVLVGGQTFEMEEPVWDAKEGVLTCVVRADKRYDVTLTIKGDDLNGQWTSKGPGEQNQGDQGEQKGDITAKKQPQPLEIELGEAGDFERRAMIVPIPAGAISALRVADGGKLIYLRADRDRVGDGPASRDLKIFDWLDAKADKKEEKTVLAGVDEYSLSADGKKVLATKDDATVVVDAAADQKWDKKVPLHDMKGPVDPRAEWRQVFTEVWRLQRDYFYEADMHKVNWPAARERYRTMLEDCVTRDDVTFVIGEMISELNVGHAYYRPPEADSGPPGVGVALLGADYELVIQDTQSAYRIKRIYEGAPWDADARNPLRAQGVDVKEGEFLLAVNGTPIDTTRDIWAAFVGLTGKTLTLTVGPRPIIDDDARRVTVDPLDSESNLRFRAWIEDNRRYVDRASNGSIGYIYVINTGQPGQNDLFRQFYGQAHKAALIIDDRWNGGGQIPTRFIELLNRPRTNYWARRDAFDRPWPPDSHQGPKAMLINGLSASGGDMFPALFRQNALGKLFGTRTWGGLVGISGNPRCIDGTMTNVPTFGYYQVDGTWGIEGHGVDPDVVVLDDPAKMPQGLAPSPTVPAMGGDPQLDAAIAHLIQETKERGYKPPQRPQGPDRSGMGIQDADK